jgi:mRNA-degrading endonuclease toxin of MazEF toxin-antitoxin module
MSAINMPIIKKSKDYTKWHGLKAKINNKYKLATYKKRDVFWCHLGENIGNEEDGKGQDFLRPVVVLKVYNNEFCLVAPLSSKTKKNKYYVNFVFNNKPQSALISQIKSVDVRRFHYKMGTVSQQDYLLILSEFIKSIQN